MCIRVWICKSVSGVMRNDSCVSRGERKEVKERERRNKGRELIAQICQGIFVLCLNIILVITVVVLLMTLLSASSMPDIWLDVLSLPS